MKPLPKMRKPWIEINRDGVGRRFLWKLRAANGTVLAVSAQTFRRRPWLRLALYLLFRERYVIVDRSPRGGVP